MSTFLETLEGRLQTLLEGTLDRIFYPGLSQNLSGQLAALIEHEMSSPADARKLAPDLIILRVSPDKLDTWQEHQAVLDEAALAVEKSWRQHGYHFRRKPRILIQAVPELRLNQVEVQTEYSAIRSVTEKTELQKINRVSEADQQPKGAFLIIDAKEHISLTKPVLNIGRRSSNDIVLNDPMVSREHLQLRADHGKYILFDLSTTGGTYVNNHPVQSTALKPGDVIRVGKTIMVYNQELPGQTPGTTVLPIQGGR